MDKAVYTFQVEWLDPFASLKRFYRLTYYVRPDGRDEIEMFDVKAKKVFLRRVHCPEVTVASLFPGARVTVFSRTLTVLDYGNEPTAAALSREREHAFVVVGPSGVGGLGAVWGALEGGGLRVGRAKMLALSGEDAARLAAMLDGGRGTLGAGVAEALARGRSVALDVVGRDARSRVAGILSSARAVGALPALGADSSVHERCMDAVWHGVRGVRGTAEPPPPAAPAGPVALSKASSFLPSAATAPATFASNAVAVLLPHVLAGGQAPALLQALLDGAAAPPPPSGADIAVADALSADGPSGLDHHHHHHDAAAGLRLTACETFDLDAVTAEEFLDVYRHVLPDKDFRDDVAALAGGVCLALEFTGPDASSVLRRLAGPRDIDMAKRLRPHSLRATFAGAAPALRALHVTDLPEDGPIEAEYFFAVLQDTVPTRDEPPVPPA